MNDLTTTNITEAKRQFVADLKVMLDLKLKSADKIEAKAVELFKFSSTTLGIVAGLKITLPKIQDDILLTIGFVVLIVVYCVHVYFMYHVFRPTVYFIVPGIPRLANSYTYNEFRQDYIDSGEDGYLEQQITDLAGTDEISGVIEDAEIANQTKVKFFEGLSLTFVIMIWILLIMSVLVAVSN
jgi:hypothetical protein